jgi:cysteinyl-tRNA synthetase
MLQIRLYNTLGGEKQPFLPIDAANVRMYVCGPTVYDFAHIGNARPAVVFDVLFRLLRHRYGEGAVSYVRNITDVDDKIIDAHRRSGEPIADITERTIAAYRADMAALGCLEPTRQPRATEHIADMVAMIRVLLAGGHAYVADRHVLFDVGSFRAYGRMSRRSLEDMLAGARVEVAPYKKNAFDFVLWKPANADEPGWDSPWGRGRPGWHIECSAMSGRYFGETFDIHGGGQDLIFPHHENEIAQSTCAHGQPFVRYWLHNGFVIVEGEKMSKSLGNFFTVHDLLEDVPGEAIRLVLLQTHYRQPLDFTRAGLTQAKRVLDRFYLALRDVDDADADADAGRDQAPAVAEALADDLNTPLALSHLHETLASLHKAGDAAAKRAAKATLLAGARLLGLLQQEPDAWLKSVRPAATSAPVPTTATLDIQAMIDERAAARRSRNFARADQIRAMLDAQGVILEDRPDGKTEWRRA